MSFAIKFTRRIFPGQVSKSFIHKCLNTPCLWHLSYYCLILTAFPWHLIAMISIKITACQGHLFRFSSRLNSFKIKANNEQAVASAKKLRENHLRIEGARYINSDFLVWLDICAFSHTMVYQMKPFLQYHMILHTALSIFLYSSCFGYSRAVAWCVQYLYRLSLQLYPCKKYLSIEALSMAGNIES